jgi:WS/DGAT/MGAT family acyltransferase
MKRLSGLDAGFLYAETPTLHFHTLKVAVIRPGSPEDYTFERFRDVLASRLHLLPPFRRRAVMVPFGLFHPVWVEDSEFDINRHLFREVAPAPGGSRELAAVVSRVAGKPLDRDKPLWEITAVEGLERGQVGFIAKLHHSIADGTAAAELAKNVLFEEPLEEEQVPTEPQPWVADDVPSRRELFWSSALSLADSGRRLPGLVASTTKRLVDLAKHMLTPEEEAAVPFRLPPTPFNAALTPDRIYATAELMFDRVKQVRARFPGVTTNDVFLAVCTGALRRYLQSRNALPTQALVAGVPAGMGGEEKGRLDGNRVSNMFALLPVHIADPAERLRIVAASMKIAKRRHEILGPELLHSWIEYNLSPSSSTFMRLWSRLKLSNLIGSPINLVVSNVPGPRVPLHIAGATLTELYSIGPILEGIGLNITTWSYVDRLYVGMLACPQHAPDLWNLADAFGPALDELVGEPA